MKLVKPSPRSCDTFVVVADDSRSRPTVFGKNSDRPSDETHEIVRFRRHQYDSNSQLRCQYITIPQVTETHAIILSRPAWLWGAEMGANEWGLCAGNEAVWTRLAGECDDGVARLLGMDMVRLVLERARTAREAITIATALLESHGQGGGCAEDDPNWCYENSFLFADPCEAWVLETAGVRWWAAERVPPGAARNISNGISIRRPDLIHSRLPAEAAARGWWTQPSPGDGCVEFDWKAAMLGGGRGAAAQDLEPTGREAAGAEWLSRLAAPGRAFGFREMAQILRDCDSGICMRGGGFASTGSQISLLPPSAAVAAAGDRGAAPAARAVHFFTTGSDPSAACYKPFAFSAGGTLSNTATAAAAAAAGGGQEEDDEAEAARRGAETKRLWGLYRRAGRGQLQQLQPRLRELEEELLARAVLGGGGGGGGGSEEGGEGEGVSPEVFDQAVRRELDIWGAA